MRGNLAYAHPSTRTAPASQARRIEIVATRAQRRARPKVAYAVLTVLSLFAIFAAQLLLSIAVSDGAYQIDALQGQQKELLRTQQALDENLDLLGSTQHLAANAAHLGMVPGSSPLFLDVATGSVAGAPGSVDRVGCGGSCNLVANSLLTGVPLTNAAPLTGSPPVNGTPGEPMPGVGQTAQQPVVVEELPAPVTH